MNKDNILSSIKTPDDLKKLSLEQLESLSGEIRDFLISTVSKTGGHLASNLGVVELTVALHKAFNCPDDKIVFDVGHQCYTHKILTSRREQFDTLRQKNGLSGFTKPSESEYDSFISGHASTAISAAYGISKAMQLKQSDGYTIAVVGDGAFTGGEAYEALNNAGRYGSKLIVILNHNEMSISKNVGAFARYLSNIRSGRAYLRLKSGINTVLSHTPLVGDKIKKWLENSKSTIKMILYRSTFFEEMGFSYFGPVDGHNIKSLIDVFNNAKNSSRPVVIQIETQKGKGYPFAEKNPGAYHAISSFDVLNGGDDVTMTDCYSNVIGKELSTLADSDMRVCAITAAMKYGTGLHNFSANHPDRFFDVGIAEEHAVTFAGGLASQGMIPVFCVYSSFLQRGYDQIIHDLAIDCQHVVLCCDRAGIVGGDGETHQGIFDSAFLSHIPNTTIYSPDSYVETVLCIDKAVKDDSGVVAVRYPRGEEKCSHSFEATVNYSYSADGNENILISYGRVTSNCFAAAEGIKGRGIELSLLKLTKIHPIENEIIEIVKGYKRVFFVEEGIKSGSIAEHLLSALCENGFKGEFYIRAIDDRFIPQATVEEAFKDLGFDSGSIEELIAEKLNLAEE